MADLTITVSLTANINGRRTTITETCTVEDVYDVGILAHEPSAQVSSIVYGADAVISMQQDTPSLAYVVNTSTNVPTIAEFELDDGLNGDSMIFGLLPGQCVILHEHANGSGLGAIDATMQTTYDDCVSIESNTSQIFPGIPEFRLFSANIAST